jgi:hypothetical protein
LGAPLRHRGGGGGNLWPEKVRKAALELSASEREEDSYGVLLLGDIQEMIREKRFEGREMIPSKDLVSEILKTEERPWGDGFRGKPLDPNRLARILRPFEISSRNLKIDGKVLKGYPLNGFSDTFDRFLTPYTPHEAATPLPAAPDAEIMSFEPATSKNVVAAQKTLIPAPDAGSSGVSG